MSRTLESYFLQTTKIKEDSSEISPQVTESELYAPSAYLHIYFEQVENDFKLYVIVMHNDTRSPLVFHEQRFFVIRFDVNYDVLA